MPLSHYYSLVQNAKNDRLRCNPRCSQPAHQCLEGQADLLVHRVHGSHMTSSITKLTATYEQLQCGLGLPCDEPPLKSRKKALYKPLNVIARTIILVMFRVANVATGAGVGDLLQAKTVQRFAVCWRLLRSSTSEMVCCVKPNRRLPWNRCFYGPAEENCCGT